MPPDTFLEREFLIGSNQLQAIAQTGVSRVNSPDKRRVSFQVDGDQVVSRNEVPDTNPRPGLVTPDNSTRYTGQIDRHIGICAGADKVIIDFKEVCQGLRFSAGGIIDEADDI